MEKRLIKLIEAARKDRKLLKDLKELAVRYKQYELGCDLRNMEKEAFPETEEVKEAKEYASKVNMAFRMIDLNATNEKACWLLAKTVKAYEEKKGKFSLKDAAELSAQADRLFD